MNSEVGHLILRWLHVLTGVMWIGQLWSLTVVQRLMPLQTLTSDTRTFVMRAHKSMRGAAPVTWITGVLLLGIIYYGGGALTSVDQSERLAKIVGITVLFAGWFVYDSLWVALARRPRLATLVSLALFAILAAGLTRVMTGRAVFIHLGAVLGTIILVNSQQRIGPVEQQRLAASEGGPQPPIERLEVAANRLRHNTALAVAVIFFMVSNHFPLVYGNSLGWVLAPSIVLLAWLLTAPASAAVPIIAREGRETIAPDSSRPRARV